MEKLYNNILFDFAARQTPIDTEKVPYLQNPPEVIDVTVGRQLFVDDFLIASTTLSPTYHKAKKFEGNPILYPEPPWEIAQSPVACPKSGGVWYDEEEKLFKMWYEAGWLRHMCYATSTDGIHWTRPHLDEEGTNLILKYEGYQDEKYFDGPTYLRPDSTTVFIDYSAPKSEKYKLFLRNPGGNSPAIVGVSADGIHFEKISLTSEVFDRSTMFYNPFRKKWVYSIRSTHDNEQGWFRARDYRECDDFLQGAAWSEEDAKFWMATDALDKPLPYIGFAPQLYNVDCVGYESLMLGMFQIMYGPENNVCEAAGVPKITELIPMYSRDGYHFSRPNRKSIINAEIHDGAWDRGYVQSVGGVTIIHGDELWIYYIGFAGDEKHAGEPWFTNGIYRNGATGLAKLRRDGFVSLDGKGSITTRKLTFTGKSSLLVNAKGGVQVFLLDEDGNELDRTTPFVGDSTGEILHFERTDVASLNGQTIRLRFEVDGELYAFGFADKNGDCGGAHGAGLVK
ncbi:MAG: glycosyl hydrolase family 32 [Clostridia bacterium]|nr:glycosyl hydrolase family 32 [Clostridia bacterium]